MSEERRNHCKAVGFRSLELWAIIAVLFIAGVAIGYPAGQMVERMHSKERIESIRSAYAEAIESKEESIRMCLDKATDAIDRSTVAIQHVLEGNGCHE